MIRGIPVQLPLRPADSQRLVHPGGPDDVDNGTGGRIIPSTSVDQYAATLASWFGVSDGDIRTILPNIGYFSPNTRPYLGFLNSA